MDIDLGFFIKFFIALIVVIAVTFILIKQHFSKGMEDVLDRLNKEVDALKSKQAELSQKVKQADEDLQKRKTEAKDLAERMRSEAEDESKSEREKIITKAREEAEEIINKAQKTKEKLKIEIEKDNELRLINFSMDILNRVLSEKAKGQLDQVFMSEFMTRIKDVDMSRIGSDINEVELVTLNELDTSVKTKFEGLLETKLHRTVTVNNTADADIGGGAILKFGNMSLDGSMRKQIQEHGAKMLLDVERRA